MTLLKEKQHTVEDDFELYSSKMSDDNSLSKIEFDEKSEIISQRKKDSLGIDLIYAMQHQVVLSWCLNLFQTHEQDFFPGKENPSSFKCLDVGSKTSFVTTLSTFANFIITDPSLNLSEPRFSSGLGLLALNNEAQNLINIKNNSINLLTSLHAIEHFGLGRYGDSIDPKGDILGLKEFSRVLTDQGYFIGAVPIEKEGRQRIVFNENRIYSISVVNKMLKDAGFKIINDVTVICPTEYVLETIAGSEIETAYIPSNKFEEIAQHWETCNNKFIDDPPDSVYIWMAKKENNDQ